MAFLAKDNGADVVTTFNDEVTHIVTSYAAIKGIQESEFLQNVRYAKGENQHIVHLDWIVVSDHKNKRQPEDLFAVPTNMEELKILYHRLVDHTAQSQDSVFDPMKTKLEDIDFSSELTPLGHKKLMDLCARPFADVLAMRVGRRLESAMKDSKWKGKNIRELVTGHTLLYCVSILQRTTPEFDIDTYNAGEYEGDHKEPITSPVFKLVPGNEVATLTKSQAPGQYYLPPKQLNHVKGKQSFMIGVDYFAEINRFIRSPTTTLSNFDREKAMAIREVSNDSTDDYYLHSQRSLLIVLLIVAFTFTVGKRNLVGHFERRQKGEIVEIIGTVF